MAQSFNIIGKVVVLQGEVLDRSPDGTVVKLKVGDPVHEGDVITTSPGAIVEFSFDDGRSYLVRESEVVTLDASVFGSELPDAQHAALLPRIGETTDISKAIAAGGSLDDLLDETAAGLGGGSGGDNGHTFVQLTRIVEAVAPQEFEFGSRGGNTLPQLSGFSDADTSHSHDGEGSTNHAPSGTNHTITGTEDTPRTLLTGDFGFNDVDSNAFTRVLITTLPTAGTLTLNGAAVIAGQFVSAADVASGLLKFVPAADGNGAGYSSFTFQVQDNGGTSHGGANLDPTPNTITINVTAVNDAPIATDDLASTPHNTPVNIAVLNNDRDPDGTTPVVTQVDGHAIAIGGTVALANGVVTLNLDGTLVFAPSAGFAGAAHFNYTISDGTLSDTATVTINVGANAAPDGADVRVTTTEDVAHVVTAAELGFSDADAGQTLAGVRIDTLASNGVLTLNGVAVTAGQVVAIDDLAAGNLRFAPDANENGSPYGSFKFSVQDSLGAFDTVPNTYTLDVTPANDPPLAVNDTATTNEDTALTITPATLLGNDTDADGDTLTISTVQAATHGTVALVGGNVVFTPASIYNGPASFTYTVSDGHGGTSTATVNVTVNPVNDPPVAVDDTAVTNEGTPLTIAPAALLGNDTDPDGDTLTISSVQGATNGSVAIVGGNVVFTPAASYNGPASFTYTVSDGHGGSSTATVDVTVNPVSAGNNPPVASDDTATTNEDTALTIAPATLLGNDTDVDGDTLTISSVQGATNGSVALVAGNVVFTPNANYNGPASFTYTISDGHGGTSTATVNVTVNAVNDPPVAVNDTATTNEDTALTIAPATLLGNDTDVDGDTLTISSVQGATNGSVAIVAGNVVFTPTANYNGPASFTYTVSDGHGGISTATVNVTVNAVNDPPVAVNDTATTNEDTALTITPATLLANDTDVDGDTLAISSVQGATNGSVAIVGGNVVFTPSANYNGPASFTYTVSDGHGGTSTATVNVTVNAVNDAPIANDDTASTAINTVITVAVLSNDSDPDGTTPVVTHVDGQAIIAGGTVAVTDGVITLNANGTLSFTPTTNFTGATSVTYTISDGSLSDTATVTINVGANTPPAGTDITITTAEDTAHVIAGAEFGFSDADAGQTLAGVRIDTLASNGTLILNGVAVTVGQVIAVADISAGNLRFVPDANENGSPYGSFTFSVQDSAGGFDAASNTYTLNVTPVNDPPVAVNDTATTNEDTPLTITPATLLGNDTDVDGDTLTISSVQGAANGSVAIVGGNVVFTPTFNYNGPASFTYTVSDGHGGTSTATVNVTVNAVNDPPVAVNDTATTNEDTALTIAPATLLGNDTDVDGDTLSVSSVQGATNGSVAIVAGNVVFTPTANYNGPASFTYTVSDGHGGTSTATVNVTVNAVNDPPVAVNDTATTNEDTALTIAPATLLGNDTDVDGDTLTISSVQGATNGSVALVTGNVVFTPTTNYNGPASFTYTISDGHGGTSTATVNVTVNAVNDPPVAVNDTATTNEDTALTIAPATLLGNDTDVDGDTLTISSVQGATNGSVAIVGGNVVFTPTANYNGPASFTYTVSDGHGGTSTATVNVTVNAVNDPPVAVNDTATTNEDTALTITPATLLGNDTDVDGDTLTISSVQGATNGSVAIVAGNVVFTPTANYNGPASFTYTASDGHGGTSTATVNVTVNPVNDAPVAGDDTASTAINTPITVAVLSNDSDPDGTTPFITQVDGQLIVAGGSVVVANGSITLNANGTLSFTPTTNFTGSTTATYTISDGTLSDTATLTVNVGANTPPAGSDIAVATAEDTAHVVTAVEFGFSDADAGQTMAGVRIDTIASHGTLTLNGVAVTIGQVIAIAEVTAGNLRFVPSTNENGSPYGSFTFSVQDNAGGFDTTPNTYTLNVTPVNDPPVAVNDTARTNEDTALTIAPATLLGNDTDVDGDTLTISSVQGAINGSVALIAGNVVFTPTANYNGPASFTYTVSDGHGGTSTATVNVTVNAVNDPPVAVNDTATTNEDTALTIAPATLLGNDTDVDGDTLTISSVQGATNGSVAIVAGNVVFTPTANYNGPASFTYTVSDGHGGTSTATVNVTVNAVNDPPVAVNDSAATNEDTALTIAPATLLGNDTDVDGDTLTISSVQGATNGSVAIVGGNVVFTPTANYNGPASFTYTASDGHGGTSTATVDVTVNAVNDPPVAVNDSAATNEDTPLTITPATLLGNDTDVDGDTLTISSVQGATNGSVAIVAGNVVFTPTANYNGPAGFTYTISDGHGGTSTATVNVTVNAVNDPPVAVNDTATTNEDTALTITPATLLGNDTDVDGDTLTISSVQGAANGSVAIVGGNVVFTPTANYNGPASFTYTVSDGHGGTSTATVNVTVNAVNDPPVAINDTATTNEDTALTITPATLLGNDTDVDGDTLTISSVQGATNGSVAIVAGNVVFTPTANYNGPASFTYTISDGHGGTSTATVNVTVNAVNDPPVAINDTATTNEDTALTIAPATLLSNDTDVDGDTLTISSVQGATNGSVAIVGGNVVFTPTANYNGPASFTYTVSDGHGGTSTATVNVTVAAVNDPPVAVNDTATTNEDTALTIAPATLLGNDTDVDGDTLTISSVQGATNGSVAIVAGNVVFTPTANYNGPASFTYTVSDGHGGTSTATVNVTVNAVNDPPVAVNDTATTNEDTALTIAPATLLGNDTDVDGDTLTISSVQGATHGSVAIVAGNVVFTPTANYNGPASFTYTISDGHGGTSTATVNVTVTAVNDPPVAVNDTATTNEDTPLTIAPATLLGNDTDVDGDTLSISSVQGATNGSVAIVAGNVVFTPTANYNGPASFTYTISDGHGGTSTATVNVTVNAVNDPPVAVNDTAATNEDTPLTITPATLLANDTDVDGDTLTISSVQGATNGSVAIVAGNVVFTPTANYNGPASFTYTISDGHGGTSTATVNVTVNAVNDPPVAVNDSAATNEDTALTIAPATLLGNDTDVDGDTLTISSVQGATNGSVALVAGNVVFTPNANYNGPASFTYTISDGHGGTSTATVNVTVNAVNDPPVAVNDTATTNEDTPLTITPATLLGNDTDVDGDTLTISSVQGATNGSVAIVAGNVVFTPTANYNGPAGFTYTISDGHGGTSTATVNVTVNAVNDPPVAVNDTATTNEDTALTITPATLLGNDTDVDGDTLTISSVQGAANGSVAIVGGNVVFTPTANYNGPASFTYTVSDGHGGTSTATVNVTVNAVNDPPVAINDTATTNEDTALTITPATLLGNDTDVDGDTLTISSVQGATNGSVAIVAGNVVFTPTANYNGPASFTYTISDGHGGTSTATVNVTVNAVNDPPVAVNDTATTNEDTALTIAPATLLGNDTDVDGDTLTISSVQGATNGSVAIVAGNVVFTPTANYNGPASFTYTVSDGHGGTSTATVNVTVNAVNDPPVAVNDSAATNEDTALTIAPATLLGNDTDVDGDTLTISSVQGATNGSVAIVGGNVVFTPTANYNGPASFTYTASDGHGGTSTATVDVTVNAVNDPPAGTDKTVTATEDTPFTLSTSDFGFTDVDGNALNRVQITALPGAGSLLLNGVAVTTNQFILATDIASGFLKFTPAANANGAGYASFGFKVEDNGGTANGGINLDPTANTITINVTAVNDNPVAVNDTATTNEDTSLTITPATLLGNDTDVDGDTLTISSVQGATNGSVAIVAGNVVFTPNSNYNGPASFTYTVSDGHGGTSTATVNVTVNAVNDPPVAVNDTATTNEDTALTIAPATLLGNDTDVDGDTLTISSVQGATNGSVAIAAGNVVFTPTANYNGPASFTYTISDGHGGTSTATVNVTVNAVNDPPVAVNDTATTNEDTALTIAPATLLGNDTDVDGDTLTISSVQGATNGSVAIVAGNVVFTPTANYNGPASFTYTVSDGHGGTSTATVNVTVNSVNDAPAGADKTVTATEDTTFILSTSDFGFTDVDVNALNRVQITTLPGAGSLLLNGVAVTANQFILATDIASGLLTFTPATNANGAGYANFGFKVEDNGGTANGGINLDPTANTVTINVTPVNDAPGGINATVTTNEDTARVFTTADFGFTDVDGNTLNRVQITALPAAGSLLLNGIAVTANQFILATDITSGLLTFAPAANANGASYATFDFKVEDNGGTANGGINLDPTANTITINVTPVNDAPAGADKTVTAFEDTTLTLAASDFGFTDVDGNALNRVQITALPGAGSLLLNGVAVTTNQFILATDIASGFLKFTPAANANGAGYASFGFKVEDNGGTANGGINLDPTAHTITVNVTPVNDAPAGTNNTLTATEDTALTLTTANFGFTDIDGDTLNRVQITALPGAGSLLLNGVAVTANQFILATDITSGLLKFTPASNANGAGYANFSFKVEDNGGTANGGINLDPTPNTITINVTAVNDNPVTVNDTATTNEDTALTITPATLLANDTDVDGDTLTISSVQGATNGTVAIVGGNVVFTPTANYNGPASFTYTASDGHGGTSTATVNVTVTAVNDAPTTTGAYVTGTEDTPYVFSWNNLNVSDIDTAGAGLSVRVMSLPGAGLLQFSTDGVAWNSVAANQLVSKATVDAGWLRFVPGANESGADSFPTNGTGNLRTDYAGFTYQANDGSLSSTTSTARIDITPVADAPTLTVKNLASTVISTSWETAASTVDSAATVTVGPTLEGWTLVTSPDTKAGGTNVFETWTSGDTLKSQSNANVVIASATGDGVDFLDMNNASGTNNQTLGITRNVTTQSNLVYDLSLDYAGWPGYTTAYTKVSVLVDGVNIGSYAGTSPQTGLDWNNLHFSFKGTGASQAITVITDATTFDANGRGAMIDDITLNSAQGAIQGNATSGTQTSIGLAQYISTALVDVDTSEVLSLTLGNIPAGGVIVTASSPFGITPIGGIATISQADLAGATLLLSSSYRGSVAIDVTSTTVEPNGSTATTTGTLNLQVLYKGVNVIGIDDAGINDAPVARDDAPTTVMIEDAATTTQTGNALTGTGTGNVPDFDPEGSAIQVTGLVSGSTSEPASTTALSSAVTVSGHYGTLQIAANGSYTYTLDNTRAATQNLVAGENSTDVFTYKITDGNSTSTATISIHVQGTQDLTAIVPPTAAVNVTGLNGEYYGYNDTTSPAAGSRLHSDDGTVGNLDGVGDLQTIINARNVAEGGSSNIVGTEESAITNAPDVRFSATTLTYGFNPAVDNSLGTNPNVAAGTHLSTTNSTTNAFSTFLAGDDVTAVAETGTGGGSGLGTTSDAAVRMTGDIFFERGNYDFRVIADDGFRLKVGGETLIEFDGNQAPTARVFRDVAVDDRIEGLQPFEMLYWEQGGNARLSVEYKLTSDTVYKTLSIDNVALFTHENAPVVEDRRTQDIVETSTNGQYVLRTGAVLDGDAGDNVLTGNAGRDYLHGGAGNDTLSGAAGADYLEGGSGNDSLDGGDGPDILDGGTGNDTMQGGNGDDLFIVDSTGDVVSDTAGTDTVELSVDYTATTYTLATGLENLTIKGTGSIDGTGNAADNRIVGGDGSNVLSGLAGDDHISGGKGNDTLTGGTGSDVFEWNLGDGGTAGTPTVDTVTDFTIGTGYSNIETGTTYGNPAGGTGSPTGGGDRLDLRDLLSGEQSSLINQGSTPNIGNLLNYIHFTTAGSDTTTHISTTGGFAGGVYTISAEDLNIILQNTNLFTATGTSTDTTLLQNLLKQGTLIVD